MSGQDTYVTNSISVNIIFCCMVGWLKKTIFLFSYFFMADFIMFID